MAGSETDAGADAVALAIRDLTEEVRMVRETLHCIALVKAGEADCSFPEALKQRTKEVMAQREKSP